MSKLPIFVLFISVGNLKPKLEWFFKLKLKPKYFSIELTPRDREEKLSSVRAAEEGLKAELHLKIHQKQTEAARRHEEKLERVRAKGPFIYDVHTTFGFIDCPQNICSLSAYLRYSGRRLE